MRARWAIVGALGATQALAWASSFYLPAVLAVPMARDVDLPPAWIFGALSLALAVSGLFTPLAGRLVDRGGGRLVLCASSVLFAVGLALLATTHGPAKLFIAWLVLGLAMAAGLLESAFAALTRLYGVDARMPISGIAVMAGLASTVGWPITAWCEHHLGWRVACIGWAVLHLTIGLLLNAWALRAPTRSTAPVHSPSAAKHLPASPAGADRRALILTFTFTVSSMVSNGLATNLPGLFTTVGLTPTAAIAMASLMGPAQIGARLLDLSAQRWSNPLLSAKVGTVLHCVSAGALSVGGAPLAMFFAIVHGAGNGVLTIVRGTLPLSLFGAEGYGARIGRILAPAKLGQAVAPFAFVYGLERIGLDVLLIAAVLSAAAFVTLNQLSMPLAALKSR